MQNKSITTLFGVLGVVAVASLIFLAHPQPPNSLQEKPFTIGGILSLTGDYGIFSEDIQRGMELAIRDEQQKGNPAVRLIVEDDRTLMGAYTATAAQKLLNVDRVDGVIVAIVQQAKPIINIMNKAAVPLLVTWDSNNLLKNAGPYVFSIGYSTEGAADTMARFAVAQKIKKVAVINNKDEWSTIIADAFAESFTRHGGTVAYRAEASIKETDYRTFILRSKEAHVDGVYIPLVPPNVAIFLRQAEQLGLTATFMTGDAFLEDDRAKAGAAAEGVYFTNIYAEDSEALQSAYQANYNHAPFDISFVSFGYDGVKTFLEARRIALEQDTPLPEALKKVYFRGSTGMEIKMGGSRFSEREEKLYQVKNGKTAEVPQ